MDMLQEFRIVITPFCNYRCFFCHAEGLTEEKTPLLLTPKDYEFLVETGKNMFGWETTTITGGEPLISPIYQETCQRIAEKGIKITTVTNASLIHNPRKVLAHNSQVNVSLHSLDPDVYQKITGSSYPIQSIQNTLIAIHTQLPQVEVHLNATIMKGLNDNVKDMSELIMFAQSVGAKAKFIDLAGDDEHYVPMDTIVSRLEAIGFHPVWDNGWQSAMSNGKFEVRLSKCGFGEANKNKPIRDAFVNPDGTLSSSSGDRTVDALHEIKNREAELLACKVRWVLGKC